MTLERAAERLGCSGERVLLGVMGTELELFYLERTVMDVARRLQGWGILVYLVMCGITRVRMFMVCTFLRVFMSISTCVIVQVNVCAFVSMVNDVND